MKNSIHGAIKIEEAWVGVKWSFFLWLETIWLDSRRKRLASEIGKRTRHWFLFTFFRAAPKFAYRLPRRNFHFPLKFFLLLPRNVYELWRSGSVTAGWENRRINLGEAKWMKLKRRAERNVSAIRCQIKHKLVDDFLKPRKHFPDGNIYKVDFSGNGGGKSFNRNFKSRSLRFCVRQNDF